MRGDARESRLSVATEGNQAINLAQRPQREGKVMHGQMPGSREWIAQLVIVLRWKSKTKPTARLDVLAGEPSPDSVAVSDLLGGIGIQPRRL